MRHYEINDMLDFFRYQKTVGYKGIDYIVRLLETDMPSLEKREEIDAIFEESGMCDFVNLYKMEEHQEMSEEEMEKEMENFMKSMNNEVLHTEFADEDFANLFNVKEIKLPTFIFKSKFLNGTMTFFGWSN